LNRRMKNDYGVDMKDLRILKTIYAVYVGKKILLSKTNEKQESLIAKLGISLEVN